jgi:glycosyltransferase involved in cell wall biosynthesis
VNARYRRLVKSDRPLISVAMPVYNGEQFLPDAIDSILGQTFTDFELIIINDGSTDKSLELLFEYQKLDSRISLITRENRNLVATLNQMIDLAKGQWFARMDQDDIALPFRFERQLKWLEQTEADICGTWVESFGAGKKRILKHPQTDEALKMELLFGSSFAHPTVFMKTKLLRQMRYDENWESCEDYDLWERAARRGWKMTNVPEVLLRYRQHNNQISTKTLSLQQDLSQLIRRRYWKYVFNFMNLKTEWIDQVIRLRDPSPDNFNMDDVELAFVELLKANKGEAREIIFDHATRLYFRAAKNYPAIVYRWITLNRKFGNGPGLDIICKLWLVSIFRLGPDGRVFHFFKKHNFGLW